MCFGAAMWLCSDCECLFMVDMFVGVRLCCILFFFFQAEDGIRDLTVTGVQTCALPIYGLIAHAGDERRAQAEPRVGNEPMGRFVLEQLQREGVVTTGVKTDPHRLTSIDRKSVV